MILESSCEQLVHNFVAVSIMPVIMSSFGVVVLVEHTQMAWRQTLGLLEFVRD